jgi:hypothetical protein
MTPEETAAACADAVSLIAANFMLDPQTYAAGADCGFAGLDFYAAGRGGALGDVDAGTVAAAFHFFEPATVEQNWSTGTKVMPAREAAARFIDCGHAWAAAHLGDGVDWGRLAELIGRVNDAGDPSVSPLFAAWRDMPEPEGDPKALALHRLMVAREHRFAVHAAAVRSSGLSPLQAMAVKSPHMLALFGWTGDAPDVTADLEARWQEAEAATNAGMAPFYAALDESERDELAALCSAALAAVS